MAAAFRTSYGAHLVIDGLCGDPPLSLHSPQTDTTLYVLAWNQSSEWGNHTTVSNRVRLSLHKIEILRTFRCFVQGPNVIVVSRSGWVGSVIPHADPVSSTQKLRIYGITPSWWNLCRGASRYWATTRLRARARLSDSLCIGTPNQYGLPTRTCNL